MLKKRLIFVLLWDNGAFCLSRNFRLQHIGNGEWLEGQYRFAGIANAIDEVVLLDVSRGERQTVAFLNAVEGLKRSLHAPLAVGGGIADLRTAESAFGAGADRVAVNSGLFMSPEGISEVVRVYGLQSVIASVDVRRIGHQAVVHISDGSQPVSRLAEYVDSHVVGRAGEILLNDIDRDGTGQGLDTGLIRDLPLGLGLPVVLMGGVGRPEHILEGLGVSGAAAVATANLLNFIGDGLVIAREYCREAGVPLPNRLAPEGPGSATAQGATASIAQARKGRTI